MKAKDTSIEHSKNQAGKDFSEYAKRQMVKLGSKSSWLHM
jgi:hypothetical protein